MRKAIISAAIVLLLCLFSCGEGLSPTSEDQSDAPKESYIHGSVYYKGGEESFPDSVFGIFVAAFKTMPTDSSGIIEELMSGNAYFNLNSLPYPADSSVFSLEIPDPPTTLEYIILSMQYDSSSIEAQRVIGVYTESGDNTKPSALKIERDTSYNITIYVDFDNLPPQPFD